GPFHYTKPYAVQSMDLFVRDDSAFKNLEDVIGRDILVQEGSFMHEYLREHNIAGRIVTVLDTGDALRLLTTGDYDAALLPEMQALHQIDVTGLSHLRSLGVEFPPIQYGIAVRSGDDELLLRLNEGLSIINRSGEFDRIHSHWFGEVESRFVEDQLGKFLAVLGVVVLLLVGALGWNWALKREVQSRTSALRKSEEGYRLLVDNASEGVVVVCDERLVFANPRAAEMSGFSREELAEMNVTDLIHAEDRETVVAHHLDVLAGKPVKEPLTCRVLTRKGKERWFLFNAVSIEWEGQPAFLDLFSEITEIKLAEQRIKRQLQQMAALRAVDTAIADSTDLHRTLRVLLEQVTAQLGVDAANVLLLDRSTQKLRHAADYGFRTTSIKSAELGLGEGYAGVAAKHRHPVHIALLRGAPKEMLSANRLALEGFYAYYGTPLIAKGEVLGVLEIYHRAPLNSSIEWMDLVETMAHQAAIAINNAELFESLEQANLELVQAYDRTIEGWARVLELRDGETEGHSQRVTELTIELARRMGFSDADLVNLRRGALLHDIGKMGIPDGILLKKGPLNPQEWQVMRQHPVYAYEMLSRVEFLQPALDIPYCHHERWDGTGYPRGIKGTDIPLAARIFSVIDVWDALRVPRPYRDAWPISKIWTYILAESGKQFDPDIVAAFAEIMRPELHREMKQHHEPLAAD
ncbi:MAG TPA: HD domain-containing phosphohydrolase, partial [Anaerolineaceae bacterium]|nr:HD domain-containing phosphohydrolase [Anaerolineaceae bacterium]